MLNPNTKVGPVARPSWSRMMSVIAASEIQRPLRAASLGNSRLVMKRSKPIALYAFVRFQKLPSLPCTAMAR